MAAKGVAQTSGWFCQMGIATRVDPTGFFIEFCQQLFYEKTIQLGLSVVLCINSIFA